MDGIVGPKTIAAVNAKNPRELFDMIKICLLYTSLLGINQMLGDKGYPTSFASATEVGYYTIDDRLTDGDTRCV